MKWRDCKPELRKGNPPRNKIKTDDIFVPVCINNSNANFRNVVLKMCKDGCHIFLVFFESFLFILERHCLNAIDASLNSEVVSSFNSGGL